MFLHCPCLAFQLTPRRSLFNNVVIAARHLQKKYGLDRIAIVDWDVHHGNGTQKAFYTESGVLFISVHQAGNFPATLGSMAEIGEGEGKGFNINIPLPPGSGSGAYDGTPTVHATRERARR